MDDATIIDFTGQDAVTDPLSDLLRKGARELLQVAVEAERDAFLVYFAERRTSDGRAAVMRSGYHPERAVQTRIGPVTVKVPKVRAKDGKPVTFSSALVPPYVRKAKSIEVALPWLYLKGISTGEMGAALKMLHDIWQAETRQNAHEAFNLFIDTFEAKYPKATECLIKDRDELLTFYDSPAQH